MKMIILIWALIFFCKTIIGQQLQTLQIGYQEPTTTIVDFTSDPEGNLYYMGYFKGILRISGQDIAAGKGGNDLFIAKTDSAGSLLWYKSFGGPKDDAPVGIIQPSRTKFIFYSNATLYVIWSTLLQSAEMDTFINNDQYISLFANYSSQDGHVNWYHTFNGPLNTLIEGDNSIYLAGIDISDSSLKYDNTEVINGIPTQEMVLLLVKTDRNGNFKSIKYKITDRSPLNQLVLYKNEFYYSYLYDRYLNKTDTLFENDTSVLFNPHQDTRIADFAIETDSIYLLSQYFEYVSGSTPYNRENDYLNVLDINFNLIRDEIISSNDQFILSGNYDNKITVSDFNVKNGTVFSLMTFTGLNNTGLPDQENTTSPINIFKDHPEQVNLSGPSATFIARYNTRTDEIATKAIGNKSFSGIRSKYDGSLYRFISQGENIWNSWAINSDLNPITGKILPNADQADGITSVKYLSDGSRIIIGSANGRTNLDKDSKTTPTGAVFFARISTDNKVIWYKRPATTFSYNLVTAYEIYNENLYAEVQYTSSLNGSQTDYVELDGNRIPGNGYKMRVLYKIDPEGKVSMTNLTDLLFGDQHANNNFDGTGIGSFKIIDENTALIANDGMMTSGIINSKLFLGTKIFPAATGFYIAKLNLNTLEMTDALKIMPVTYKYQNITGFVNNPAALVMNSIDYDQKSGDFFYYARMTTGQDPAEIRFKVHNGTYYTDTLTFQGKANELYGIFIRANFEKVKWASQIGPSFDIASTARIDSLIAFSGAVSGGGLSSAKVNYNDTLVTNNGVNNNRFLGLIGSKGELENWRNWPNSPLAVKCESVNGKFLISSSVYSPFQLDTLGISQVSGVSDAITVQFDKKLHTERIFHLSSPESDAMNGCDTYRDSLISFAFTSQGSPSLKDPFTSGAVSDKSKSNSETVSSSDTIIISPLDRDPDAYLSQAVIACTKTRWYKDSDGDGFGDPLTWIDECLKPQGFVANNLDCNDAEPTIDPCPDPTTILKNEDNETINIFPNPANGKFQVEINGMAASGVSIKVYNSNGKEVFYKQLCPPGIFSIDLSGQKNGLYLLKVVNGKQQIVKKVVLQN